MSDSVELPPSLRVLAEFKTMEDLVHWATKTYGKGAGRMRCPEDLEQQSIDSAEPSKTSNKWTSTAFVRLPETVTTYGGYQTVCIAKVVSEWPGGRIVSVIYEP
jgi:hypothetical protein